MKLKNLLFVGLCLSTLAFSEAFGQTNVKIKNTVATKMPDQRTCGTGIPPQQFEAFVQNCINNMSQYKAAVINYTLPVIIHIIHNGEAVGVGSNISNAQALSQITILNDDYQGMNADSTLIPGVFKPVFAHSGISFCLAKTDPLGNPLVDPGINRIDRNAKGWTAPPYTQAYINGTIKPNSIWDPNQYLNIWCMSLGGGLLGYATFPNPGTSGLAGIPAPYGTTTTDGIVVLNTAFGNTGTAASPYNKGRTAVHEVGHWLGLRHIWGDGTCATDYCNDTPPAQTSNGACPTHPLKVGVCAGNTNGEMFMNYMDYVNDACMYMFSEDQKTRMVAILNGSPMRTNLTASTKCNPPAALDAGIASIIVPSNNYSACNPSITPRVVLTNYGSITLTSCTINYMYDAGPNQTTPWTGSLATGASATITLPSTVIAVGNHTFTSSTSSPNAGVDGFTGNDQKINTYTITAVPVGSALPFFEGFEGATFVPAGWQYTPPNPPYSWSRTTAASGFGTSTASAKMDHFSSPSPINGQLDIMRTPPINFSTANSSLKVYWEHAYAKYAAGDLDSLIVEVSTDCGGNWTRIFGNGGTSYTTAPTITTNFVPTATQWAKDSASLAVFAGQSAVYLRFKSKSDWGNNLYVDNINIKFNAVAPVANFSVNPNPVCVGQSVSITDMSTNMPTSWSYTLTGGSPSTSTVQNPAVTYSASGVYSITLVASNGSGSSVPVVKTVTVNALPNLTVTSTPTSGGICAGNTATITSSGATTYTLNTGATGTNISVTPSVTTIYTVTGTNAAGCTNTKTITITVNANPTVNITPASATICATNSVALTGSGATTYSWSTGASTASISVSPSVTTTYTVTGTNAAGCVNTKTAGVTVNANPTVNITPASATICASNTLSLLGSGAASYTWSTGSNAANIIVSPTVTTTYTLSGSNAASCLNTNTVTITVNPTPTININPPSATICATGTVGLFGSGAITYTWSTGSNAANIVVSPSVTTIYTLSGSNAAACIGSKTVNVTVNPLPTVTITANPVSICPGSSSTLTASGSGPGPLTYSWSTGATTAVITSSTAAVYTATVTNGNGCTGVQSYTLGSSPGLSINATSSPTAICAGNSATLTASGASTYTWSTGATTSVIVVSPSVTATYTVSGTSGSCVGSQTVSVIVNPNPTVTASSSTTTVCPGTSALLTASGASTYSWSTGASGSTTSVTPSLTTVYSVTGTTGAGCTNTNTVSVTVAPGVTVGVTATSASICSGQSSTITATGATTYLWNTSATTAAIVVTPSSTTNYTVTGTNGSGCTNTKTITITVNSTPTVSVLSSTASICSGNNATLTASGATTYSWSTGASGNSISVNPTSTATYTVTGFNGSCSGTQTITVSVTPNPTIAATASPNAICSGQSSTLTATGATTYSWSSGGTGASTVVNPTSTTTYTVTGSNGSCSGTQIITVNVTPNPTIMVTASPAGICSGQSSTLTATGATTYSWSTGGTSAAIVVNPTSSTNYTVTGSNGSCSNSQTLTVSVGMAPSIMVAASSSTVCAGSTVTLAATGAITYSWSSGGTSATTVVTPASSTVYTVTGSSGGCPATATVAVGVISGPTVSASSSASLICVGQSVVLTASGATTYSWSTGATSFSVSDSPTVSTTYSVVGTTGACSSSAVSSVSVSPCTNINQVAVHTSEFGVYPNPTSGEFVISTNKVTDNTFVEVYNNIGQLIIKSAVKDLNNKVNLVDEAEGVYHIRVIQDGKQVYQTKIVKN